MKTKLHLGLLASSLLAVAAVEGCNGSVVTGTSTGAGGGTATASATGGDGSASTTAGSTTATSTTSTGGGGTSTSSSSGSFTSTSGAGGGASLPVAPQLGAQIDRIGRPAISAALIHTFDADPAVKGMAKDAYNQLSDPAAWGPQSGPELAKNQAIFDGLDTVCGNQVFAGPMVNASRYANFAGALADDRIYTNMAAAACTTYLAVEANASGLLVNMDCGGRKLDYDVIDESYSLLVAGVFVGVNDGVAADADTKGQAFPYVAAPH